MQIPDRQSISQEISLYVICLLILNAKADKLEGINKGVG